MSKILHASKAGFPCDRNLFYSVNNYALEDVSERTQRIFDTGNILEPFIVELLRNDGWIVDYNQGSQKAETQVEIQVKDGTIIGHHDCIISKPGHENVLIDIKTMNDRSFTSWKRNGSISEKPQYVDQIHIYAYGLIRLGINIEELGIVGFNKNNSDLHIDFFKFSHERINEIIGRAVNIFELNEAPEPGQKLESWCCNYCGFKNICEIVNNPKNTHVDDKELFTTDPAIISAIQLLNDAKSLNRTGKEMEEEAKSIIDEKVRKAGYKSVQAGNLKLTLNEIVSARFDSTSFKKAHPDLVKEFTKESRSLRYDIKEI